MRKLFKPLLAAMALIALSAPAAIAAPEIGKPAPDFTATDTNGNTVKLSDYKGKIVVLEWTNHECPFVIKHYGTGNMQKLQEEATAKGVVWLSIVSSAEGNQGFVTPEQANAITAEQSAKPTAKILDVSGEIGHLYEAKTTPHMFVVDAEGNLAYAGAIDDNPSPRQSDVEGAKNYVKAALENLWTGKPVETASTQSYGCSVKYKTQ